MAREAASVAYRNLAGHRPGAAQQEAPLRGWDIARLPHDRRRDEEGVDQLVLPEETARDGEEEAKAPLRSRARARRVTDNPDVGLPKLLPVEEQVQVGPKLRRRLGQGRGDVQQAKQRRHYY